MKMLENKFYVSWIKGPWSYVTGAVLLSIFQIIHLAITGGPWSVSGILALWGAWLLELVGVNVDRWFYFGGHRLAILDAGFLAHPGTMSNLGIIFGALLATLIAFQFKLKRLKTKRQIVAAILGGFFMGYGARIAGGCNIGALFSGITTLSLSGWVFAVFLFLGAIVGSKMLVKFFIV
ncbi:YeeE/YedE family protein [Dehalococcoidia bacterium]|nr:YeeE/YedE family protein [Dehalococcoidia bacterium]MCL0073189.1 YeeE/YedE family protein [Dehalococcoidia bacterium]MCL0092800.1 YeeE/YedE family protein [Dehalococcoidia bacterium]MCL0104997.1 YeeE/YedE family protein [Dehalococcoidia bacterium]